MPMLIKPTHGVFATFDTKNTTILSRKAWHFFRLLSTKIIFLRHLLHFYFIWLPYVSVRLTNGHSNSLSLCGSNSISSANARMVYLSRKLALHITLQ